MKIQQDLFFKLALISLYSVFTILRLNFRRLSRKNQNDIELKENHIFDTSLSILIFYEVITFFMYLFFDSLFEWADYDSVIGIRSLGVGIGFLSIILFYWTHISLGKNFSHKIQIKKNQELITTGPYKWVRHPMYTAFYLLHVAVFLIVANWFIGLSWILGLTLIVGFRIKTEEKLLSNKFGVKYEEYKKNTGRFLPKMYTKREIID